MTVFHSHQMQQPGTLYIVATPIGNLADITFRAVETLQNVDLICAEDTRTSQKLLQKYDIKKPLQSFHAHSSDASLQKIITQIKQGKNVALISDAGTPAISDPGFLLVKNAVENNITVTPIPGATAAIAALCASGLPSDKFTFLGFPPAKKGRQTLFKNLHGETRTIIFYESPHRLLKTISQLHEFLGGERRLVIARELTKLHEEWWRGSLAEAEEWLTAQPKIRGEFVLLISGRQ